MSAKAAAAYHGRDIIDRLRTTAPYTEDGPTMRDAADEIERLRATADRRIIKEHDDLDHLPKGSVVLDRLNDPYQCIIAGEGIRGSVWSGEDIVGVDDMILPGLLLWTPDE